MAEKIYGLEIKEDLPEGWQPVDVAVIIKCLVPPESVDAEGTDFPYRMTFRCSEGLSVWEVAGMAGCIEADAKSRYVGDPDIEDD
jgi:hypothetical protein